MVFESVNKNDEASMCTGGRFPSINVFGEVVKRKGNLSMQLLNGHIHWLQARSSDCWKIGFSQMGLYTVKSAKRSGSGLFFLSRGML